jgi:hypothetical protein
MVGILDHPEEWPPSEAHSGNERRTSWNVVHDDLPRWRTEKDPDFAAAKKSGERRLIDGPSRCSVDATPRKEHDMSGNAERVILAGGCYWIMQQLLRDRDGVISTRVGWIGGENENPT